MQFFSDRLMAVNGVLTMSRLKYFFNAFYRYDLQLRFMFLASHTDETMVG
jgi:hypothetical protein